MNQIQEIVVKFIIFILGLILLIIEFLEITISLEIRIGIIVLILALLILIIIVEIRIVRQARRLCDAFIYKHKENGSILYCKNDQGDETRDFIKLGKGRVPCNKVEYCALQ